jgi:hypothetical protein
MMSKIKQILIAFFVPLILAVWCPLLSNYYYQSYPEVLCWSNGNCVTIFAQTAYFQNDILNLLFLDFIALAFILPIFILTKSKSIKRTEIKLND